MRALEDVQGGSASCPVRSDVIVSPNQVPWSAKFNPNGASLASLLCARPPKQVSVFFDNLGLYSV